MPPSRFWQADAGRAFVGRLATGSDLVREIERYCLEQEVMAAQVTVVGAVRHARYAYYEQTAHRYQELESATHHEIVGFVGNVSLRDKLPFLHAHATFADATRPALRGLLEVQASRRRPG